MSQLARLCAVVGVAFILSSCSSAQEEPEPKAAQPPKPLTRAQAQQVLDRAASHLREQNTASFAFDYGISDTDYDVDGRFDIRKRTSDVTVNAFAPHRGLELHVVTHRRTVMEEHLKTVGYSCLYRYDRSVLDKKRRNAYKVHPAAELLLEAEAGEQDAKATRLRVIAQARLSDALFTTVPSLAWMLEERVPDDVRVPAVVNVTREDDHPGEPAGVVETVVIEMGDVIAAAERADVDVRAAAKRSRIARKGPELDALKRASVEIYYGDYGSPVPAEFPDEAGYLVESMNPNNRTAC